MSKTPFKQARSLTEVSWTHQRQSLTDTDSEVPTLKTKKSAQRASYRDGYPMDVQGHSGHSRLLHEKSISENQNRGRTNRVFGKPCFCPLPKRGHFDENGENDEFAFYPVKTRVWLLRPPKTTKMTKMAGVTQEKAWFRKGRVCSSLTKGDGGKGTGQKKVTSICDKRHFTTIANSMSWGRGSLNHC